MKTCNKPLEMKMEKCTVGLFNLPGVVFDKAEMTDEMYEEISSWADENHCGTPMSKTLWSFRSEAKRDWFIIRWSSE